MQKVLDNRVLLRHNVRYSVSCEMWMTSEVHVLDVCNKAYLASSLTERHILLQKDGLDETREDNGLGCRESRPAQMAL